MARSQRPIELIQARTLISNLSTAAFLVDGDGNLLFYNEPAGELLGLRFDEAGPMRPEEWGTRFEPYDPQGKKVPVDELPLAIALRAGRPGHAQLRIRSARGEAHDIAVSAFPIVAKGATQGALAIFWAIEGDNRPR